MRYIQSESLDPCFNLALEQYVFDSLDTKHDYFMLWQNDNAIIIGKHQNTIEEINTDFVKTNNISVVRRLSGGGAVYHDLGNLNFTFITGKNPDTSTPAFDFAAFCRPITQALAAMGVNAEISGRNDMTINGKKFSGNAQYIKGGRVMHHGTLLFDSNLDIVAQALNVTPDKIASKGVKSTRSRVTNIKPFVADDISTNTTADFAAIKTLRRDIYATWDWNYGRSPAFTLKKARRIENCGSVQVYLDVGEGGVISDTRFYGDYFGNGDSDDISRRLVGCPLRADALRAALDSVNIANYFNNLDMEGLIGVMVG
jgi:lipoate-protein ligase A